MKTSEDGFVMVAAVFLVPLLLVIMASLWGLRALLQPWESSLHICRRGLLDTQKTQLQDAEKILALNPQVQNLRMKAQLAEQDLQMAWISADPAAVGAAEAEVREVQIQQRLLQERQDLLRLQGQAHLRSNWEKFRDELIRQAQQFQQQTQNWLEFSLVLQGASAPVFSVRRVPSQDPGPAEWKMASSTEAVLSWRWEMNWRFSFFKKSNPRGLSAQEIRWTPFPFKKQQDCAVTIAEIRQQWQPVLTTGRFFWN